MKPKGLIIIGLIVAVLETMIFGLWIYNERPTPDVSIALVIIIPLIFGANIIIGLVLYFLKKRQFANVAFLNAVAAPVIFYFLWALWFMGWKERNYMEYSFEIDGSKFEVLLSKTSNYFSLSDITNKPNGSTTGLFLGEYQMSGDTVSLVDGQTKMKIVNNKLFGFPKAQTSIQLTHVADR